MRIVISTSMDAQKKKRKCGVCGQLGHNARTCSYSVDLAPRPRPVPVPRKCGTCGMLGHKYRTCSTFTPPLPASNNTYQAPMKEETSSKRSCTSSENVGARLRNITLLLLDNDIVVIHLCPWNHLRSLELKVFGTFQQGSMIERVARLEDILM